MSIKTKMTAIADKIRSILGIPGYMDLDQMALNLNACQTEVNIQAQLLERALLSIEDKESGVIEVPPVLQNKSVIPSEETQVITPDTGYNGLSSVSIGAIDNKYIGSGVQRIGAKEYTPGANGQVISSGKYLSGDQIIIGDPDLKSANIKNGVSIFGITGSFVGGVDTSDADATASDIAQGKVAYSKNGRVVGNINVVKEGSSYGSDNSTCRIDKFDNTPYLTMESSLMGRTIFDAGSSVSLRTDAGALGNATASDVLSGVTFSSKDGLCMTGTKVIPSGLPSGISKITTGTFKLSSDKSSYSIKHNLGVVPSFCSIVATGSIVSEQFPNHVIMLFYYKTEVSIFGGATSPDLQHIAMTGDSAGAVYCDWGGSGVDLIFSASTVSAQPPSGLKFKSGVTYRWICGVTDF